jgi:hypothetical protein
MQNSVHEQVRALERCLAMADIPGAAVIIGDLHRQEKGFDPATQRNINQLECIFLSLVHAHVERLQ